MDLKKTQTGCISLLSLGLCVLQCESEYLPSLLLIKLALLSLPKYQCTHWAESTWLSTEHLHRDGGGQVPAVRLLASSEEAVTYCFTGTLRDLLGVKVRYTLVYTRPWISAWNMSTSSQPISHRGGAAWAADTSRFPWTMGPIPQTRPSVCDLEVRRHRHRQRHSTAPVGHRTITSPGTLILGPASDSGSLTKRGWMHPAKRPPLIEITEGFSTWLHFPKTLSLG